MGLFRNYSNSRNLHTQPVRRQTGTLRSWDPKTDQWVELYPDDQSRRAIYFTKQRFHAIDTLLLHDSSKLFTERRVSIYGLLGTIETSFLTSRSHEYDCIAAVLRARKDLKLVKIYYTANEASYSLILTVRRSTEIALTAKFVDGNAEQRLLCFVGNLLIPLMSLHQNGM